MYKVTVMIPKRSICALFFFSFFVASISTKREQPVNEMMSFRIHTNIVHVLLTSLTLSP